MRPDKRLGPEKCSIKEFAPFAGTYLLETTAMALIFDKSVPITWCRPNVGRTTAGCRVDIASVPTLEEDQPINDRVELLEY